MIKAREKEECVMCEKNLPAQKREGQLRRYTLRNKNYYALIVVIITYMLSKLKKWNFTED